MAKIDFGGTIEEVITSEEFPLDKAREVLKEETIAVLGYGVQGPGQALNMRDNGINVIVGQREGGASWDQAVADGFVPGETLFPLEEAAKKGTIIQYLLSDAGQVATWPKIKECLNEGDALYFSHGFSIVYKDQTQHRSAGKRGCHPGGPQGIGPHGAHQLSGRQRHQLQLCHPSGFHRPGQGADLALGIAIGSGYLFPPPSRKRSTAT